MALLNDFTSCSKNSKVDTDALKEANHKARQLIKELHDSSRLRTWEAIGLFTLEAAHDLKEITPGSEWCHLRSSFGQFKDALNFSTSSETETKNLLPSQQERLNHIAFKLHRQELNAHNPSREELDYFLDSLFMEWALRSLRALELRMIMIIYKLNSFYKDHGHLGSKVIGAFGQLSTKLSTVHISPMSKDLFEFLKVFDRVKYVIYARMLF